MAYSKGYDKLLFVTGTHQVMKDKHQLVIQHPIECPSKGSRLDRYKTFHHLPTLPEKLERCGITLDQPQWEQLATIERSFNAKL